MGIDFVLRLADGTSLVTLPDPGSGTFNAAGDFDDVLFTSASALEVLDRADMYGDNIIFENDEVEGMLRDIDILLTRDSEKYGPDAHGWRASGRRGLLRLREMALFLRDHPGSTIVQNGD